MLFWTVGVKVLKRDNVLLLVKLGCSSELCVHISFAVLDHFKCHRDYGKISLLFSWDDFLRSQLIITTSSFFKKKKNVAVISIYLSGWWWSFFKARGSLMNWIHVTAQYCACIIITQGAVCSQSPGSCTDSTCVLGTHQCHNLYKLAAHRHWSDKALKRPEEYLDPSGFWALLGRFAALHKQDSV